MLNQLDHVGVVVDNLDQAKRFLGDVLGLPLVRQFAVPERNIEVAFFSLGNAEIEVIQINDPDEKKRRMGDASIARIDHIAVGADDVAQTADELKKRGLEMQTAAPAHSDMSASIFTKAPTSGGVTFQIIKWTEKGRVR